MSHFREDMKFSRADKVTISLREMVGGGQGSIGSHETLHQRNTERLNEWIDGKQMNEWTVRWH